jgi:predicted dithiol-disulfide oxidoreductase (DUF899 family)
MSLPPVVTEAEWQHAVHDLRMKEKAATRVLDVLAAERRELPMVRMAPYELTAPDGAPVRLADLFEGRRQLLVYHFMLGSGGAPCVGCSAWTDNVGDLTHLRQRDTSFALVSRAPQPEIRAVQERMGWTAPWYSASGSSFHEDLGLVSEDGGERFALSAFLRDGDDVYRTYYTAARGVDRLRLDFNLLDLTAYGRQETWEVSPDGWPQTPPYTWWRLHDQYA